MRRSPAAAPKTPIPEVPSADLQTLRWEVARSTGALRRADREGRPLTERRRHAQEVTAALKAVVAAGGGSRREAHAARTALELHLLATLSTPGVAVPVVERTTSLEATGPRIAGMSMSPVRPYGLAPDYGTDLSAALDGPQPAPTSRPVAEVRELPGQRTSEDAAARPLEAASA